MTSKIYVITRFNAPCFPTRTDLAERRLDDDWLRERVRLFKEYCFPSVVNQNCDQFHWIIWCHPDSPEWLQDELYEINKPHPWLWFIYGDSYYQNISTNIDTLVTIRLDNDDMIHEDFVKTIHDHIEVFQKSGLPRQVYSFTKGYRYYDLAQKTGTPLPAGSLVEVEMPNNPFLVMFANLRERPPGQNFQPTSPNDHLVYYTNHGFMTKEFPTVYNNDLRAWAWVYHGGNTASIQCKAGDVVDNKILKEFGR